VLDPADDWSAGWAPTSLWAFVVVLDRLMGVALHGPCAWGACHRELRSGVFKLG
jgi:hypothetical protein